MSQKRNIQEDLGDQKMHLQTNHTICKVCNGTQLKTIETELGYIEIDCPRCNDKRIKDGFPYK